MPRDRKGRRIALAALVVLASAGAIGASKRSGLAAAAAASAVTIDNYAFGPAALAVKRGTTVTWTNSDEDVHTVTSAGGPAAFKSPALDTGDTFSFTFRKPGTYTYICSVHPYMHGTIVVR